MRVLVTGGAGHLGSHLVDYLVERGHDVAVIDNLSRGRASNLDDALAKGARLHGFDLRDGEFTEKIISKERPEIIYALHAHAAEIQSLYNPIYTTMVNYVGFLNLLVPAINYGVKTVLATTSMAVYGANPRPPFREDEPTNPEDPYGVTKAATEQILRIYGKEFGLNWVVIRPHNVYGERQDLANPYRNVLGIWMNRIMKGLPPIIYGDGEQRRAFTYIDDCTKYIAEAAFTPKAYGEIINIGSEEAVTLNEACAVVVEAMGRDLAPVHGPPRPAEVREAYCSSDKARRLLGYETSTPLREGVAKMARWAWSVGPRDFEYWDSFEIKKKVLKVWEERQL